MPSIIGVAGRAPRRRGGPPAPRTAQDRTAAPVVRMDAGRVAAGPVVRAATGCHGVTTGTRECAGAWQEPRAGLP
ncbi:hypothetical protein Ppa06_35610 [Planomonospora parontospora subsp. parontospora]|uniref:Uncharacterized protein n=2 Tax=Planomonospora parontospora TaxID=58119 RepID=A0AA37BHP5_9ACTN|nr:hypothetical protein GCM10010126_32850 [Planomonospora parontospora]GII09763.1 hypothetical protein Ppa06_35610 [Planomonospora parontospora subsp. parontospora]